MSEMHTDIQALERQLGVSLPPGTEVMKDVGNVHFVKSGNSVLVPQPSANADDPLNWHWVWKMGAIATSIILGFIQGFGPLSISSQVVAYMEEWDRPLEDVLDFTGIAILLLGFSNFLWVPVATSFGRRPCAIFSSVVALGSAIWRARANTYGSFYGACILSGIGCGPAETLPPMIIADTIFINQRGTFIAMYWTMYFGSLMVGPVVAGTMTDAYGWRSFWWLNVALMAFLIVLCFFCLPETRYKRAATEVSYLNSVKEGEAADKPAVGTFEDAPIVEEHVDANLGRGRPSKMQYMPVSKLDVTKKSLGRDLLLPWYLFAFLIVQWASFSVSWSSSNLLALNLTQSAVFSAPPYNFSSASVGYTNLAIFAGALIGFGMAGPIGDWLSLRSTKRNGMIREAEFRLPVLWVFCIFLIIGTTVSAVGYDKQWSWPVINVVGYAFVGIQVAAIPAICISYVVDSYKPVSGEFLVSMTVNKNLWGYGLSKFIVPFYEKAGDQWRAPMLMNLGLSLVFILLGSILLFWKGKTVREWTRHSFVHGLDALSA